MVPKPMCPPNSFTYSNLEQKNLIVVRLTVLTQVKLWCGEKNTYNNILTKPKLEVSEYGQFTSTSSIAIN